MKPLVGMIINVWFRGDYAPGDAIFGSQPWPAVITHVWDDGCVNAYVFPKDGSDEQAGKTGAISSINYAGREEAPLVWWEWPRHETRPWGSGDPELARLKSSHMQIGGETRNPYSPRKWVDDAKK